MVDWTEVLVAAVPAIPATLAVLLGVSNRRSLQTPSGDRIGAVMERTHDLAAVSTAAVAGTVSRPSLDRSVERINGDPDSPVTVSEATAQPEAAA